MIITEKLVELAAKNSIQVRIEDARPQILKLALQDSRSDMVYNVIIRCRRMGEDNGKDQLVIVSNYLRQIGEYVRKVSRQATPKEMTELTQILANR